MEDLKASLEGCSVFEDFSCLGSFQINHLWLISLKTSEAKQELLGVQQLLVREKKCFNLYPNRAEVCLTVHWVSTLVLDDTTRKAIKGFGPVNDLTREVRRVEGFGGIKCIIYDANSANEVKKWHEH